eukprot:scaffold393512_cov871-Cyclotella_meneghiniana.AAC.1
MEDIDAAGSDEDPMIGTDDDDTTHIRGTSPLEAHSVSYNEANNLCQYKHEGKSIFNGFDTTTTNDIGGITGQYRTTSPSQTKSGIVSTDLIKKRYH